MINPIEKHHRTYGKFKGKIPKNNVMINDHVKKNLAGKLYLFSVLQQ